MEYFTPRISEDTKEFWEGCRKHELRLQQCGKCGKIRYPAGYLCPECLSEEYEWVSVEPKGTLYSYIKMVKPFHPSMAEKVPYYVATVDLNCGARILMNASVDDGDEMKCGDSVVVGWEDGETYSRPIARKEMHIE